VFCPGTYFKRDDKLIVHEDGIGYSLSPSDSIVYNNTTIPLQPFFEAIKKCELFLWDNHKEWMNQSSHQFRLSFYERKGQATAFGSYDECNDIKSPNEIKMCMSYFLNLHNFKFVLGHEVGHFHEYLIGKKLKPVTNDLFNMIVGSIIIFALTISISMFLISFKEKLPEWMITFDILFAFVSFFYYTSYSATHFNKVLNSHYVEYEADQFASKLFPECSSAYFGKTWIYSDTHPANILRILALKRNIRVYIPIIVPWLLCYSDSYKEYKESLWNFIKEVLQSPIYLVELIQDLMMHCKNKLRPLILEKSANSIKNDLE
jgi:hypothetical protein